MSVVCAMFGHSIKHQYSKEEPKYIKYMYCARRGCNYTLELS